MFQVLSHLLIEPGDRTWRLHYPHCMDDTTFLSDTESKELITAQGPHVPVAALLPRTDMAHLPHGRSQWQNDPVQA